MLTIAAGIVAILVAILLDSEYFIFIMKPEYQVILGTIVIAIILFDNAFAGLLCGLAVIIMYTRVIAHKYGINLDIMALFEEKHGSPNKPTVMKNGNPMNDLVKTVPYITPKNLLDAQNNIVDPRTYNDTYIGITNLKGSPIYSAEGTDKEGKTNVQGYDGSVYIGSAVKF